MDFFSGLAHTLVSPLVHFTILIVVGLLIQIAGKWSRLRNSLWSIACIWLLLCSQPLFSGLLLRPLEFHFPVVKVQELASKQVDGIAVLACYYHTNDNMPEINNWNECALQRLLQAYRAHKTTKAPIYLTGGHFLKDANISYADQAKALLIQMGVEQKSIISIPIGKRTSEEIAALHRNVDVENFVIISSATHMRRLNHILNLYNVKQFTLMPIDFLSGDEVTLHLALPAAYSVVHSERAIYEYFALAQLAL